MSLIQNRRWLWATVFVQGIALFIAMALLCAMVSLIDRFFGNIVLHSLTNWILDFLPTDGSAIVSLCLAVGLTEIFIGLALVVTSESDSLANQRIIFLTAVTWWLVLISILVVFLAFILPFIPTMDFLSNESYDEYRAALWRVRRWNLYSVGLIVATIALVWRQWRRKRNDRMTRGRGSGLR